MDAGRSAGKERNMNISVCVDALYPDIPCEKAIARAANAGASAVEIWGWWDKNIPLVKAAMDENKYQMAALCTRFISLADESCLGDYLKGLDETIAVCKALDCKRIISQVGQSVQGVPADKQHMNLVNGLKAAAKRLGITPPA